MTDSQLQDRVREVLNRADESSVSMLSEDGPDGETGLVEAAAEANGILESADSDELLAAVGLDTLEDGTEPASIPEAIARGEQENVEDLHRLLRLSKLADRTDEASLEGAVDDLREAIGERAESTTETAASAADGDDDGGEPAAAEGNADAAENEAAKSGTADRGETESEPTDDVGDRLRSAMRDSFGEFGDEISQLKARLESAHAGSAGSGAADDSAGDETPEAETDEDEGGDRGLLGSGLDGGNRGTPGGPSRHSTMAPPPSQRADMRGPVRHSTMPDKHG
ncbi:hypothetical protein [Natrinema salaciae]|uniref:Uncharacterized protein n=1 Tax=Natrinema salaciae TaxID=1186196 RepID=A0A1H9G264_9EURY|nr:hypothetical protein [Natrinema salaciae]SEQ44224.1 hypothetical protein SAMN04489841_1752 [Natrinema salaciae]